MMRQPFVAKLHGVRNHHHSFSFRCSSRVSGSRHPAAVTFLVGVWGHFQHQERICLRMMFAWHPWASLTLFRSVMFIGHLCRFLTLYSFVGISIASEFREMYQASCDMAAVRG